MEVERYKSMAQGDPRASSGVLEEVQNWCQNGACFQNAHGTHSATPGIQRLCPCVGTLNQLHLSSLCNKSVVLSILSPSVKVAVEQLDDVAREDLVAKVSRMGTRATPWVH